MESPVYSLQGTAWLALWRIAQDSIFPEFEELPTREQLEHCSGLNMYVGGDFSVEIDKLGDTVQIRLIDVQEETFASATALYEEIEYIFSTDIQLCKERKENA